MISPVRVVPGLERETVLQGDAAPGRLVHEVAALLALREAHALAERGDVERVAVGAALLRGDALRRGPVQVDVRAGLGTRVNIVFRVCKASVRVWTNTDTLRRCGVDML